MVMVMVMVMVMMVTMRGGTTRGCAACAVAGSTSAAAGVFVRTRLHSALERFEMKILQLKKQIR